jgi:hypothetical protein
VIAALIRNCGDGQLMKLRLVDPEMKMLDEAEFNELLDELIRPASLPVN